MKPEVGVRKYDPVAVSSESTVVAEYVAESNGAQGFQSESALEAEFIRLLESQAYEFLPIPTEADLVANLRTQLEIVNDFVFSDGEWDRFFSTAIASAGDGPIEKTVRVQEDHVQLLTRDDGSTKNITLLDKANIHNNRLQVINQYETDRGEGGARYANRYDVTVLVNGLPMVHVELKRRGVDIREAFNQINRYARDSFWAGSGLFEYVQLFVISNGTFTKYYSNTVRRTHVDEQLGKRRRARSSNSFEFTSWWADANNKPIQDLTAFAKTFFAKHTLLNILTRYCVLTVDRALLVMRPYQIVATERILRRIEVSTNYKQLGTIDAGGYVWHTTGSGKTLTSFKAAQLATRLPSVQKVLFVVDRKDLDYQTMQEYDQFEKGAANSNTSTKVLKQQLEDPNAKIIITTIQKLSTFIKSNAGHEIYSGHVVLIFDECHRSQFGDMHAAITKAFRRFNLFGFTGTPIFAENAPAGGGPALKTTEQVFGEKLHTYTIVDAITDKNVLPFRIDYVDTVRVGDVDDKQVSAIDTEKALLDPRRVEGVVSYVLKHFSQKTRRESSYEHSVVTNVAASSRGRRQVKQVKAKQRARGFNSIFATASIDAARRYYTEFRRQQEDTPPAERLKIALIYSYAPNADDPEGTLEDEAFDTDALPMDAQDFLEASIQDYNQMFNTSYDTSADRFQNYYKDLSQRLKNREVDMVIVVNMFLTGFDATTLNTLWVDKNLRSHGLLQAFSRTNRILNSVKTYGNIISFRNLEEETNAALSLFGNKDAHGIVVLKPYENYYQRYVDNVRDLLRKFPPGADVIGLGETAQKRFISLFGEILRLLNILTSFDEFAGNEILTPRQHQDYTGRYNDLYTTYKQTREADKEPINEDVVFEIELIKQVEINIDYILTLLQRDFDEFGSPNPLDLWEQIAREIDASPSLRNKKDLIEDFVANVSAETDIDVAWEEYVARRRKAELQDIIAEENLNAEAVEEFVKASFRVGQIVTTGTAITKILPPASRFSSDDARGVLKQRVLSRFEVFLDRFLPLTSCNAP